VRVCNAQGDCDEPSDPAAARLNPRAVHERAGSRRLEGGDRCRREEALDTLYKQSSAAKDLGAKAAGILVFPSVVKGGIGIGGEYGEGALLVHGKTAGYYNTASGSIGFQLGVQKKSQAIMFMNQKELDKFLSQEHDGWKAGVDGSVALATLGAGGQLDTETAKKPIVGFIFSNKGLMYNLTFEGSKITKLNKDK
jgi:lipid-binding SYLF domain-containing protein